MGLALAANFSSLTATTPLLANSYVDDFMGQLMAGQPDEPEFFQAVREVTESVAPVIEATERYRRWRVLDRMAQPNRVFQFPVTWTDKDSHVQIHTGWRVQFNSALGPYKGGLRFHPSVNLSVLKFLGFEQTFKNALLTDLQMGGAKGGSNFDPRGKSDSEVMHFCQRFMGCLARHIGPRTDVPAGDIGVGAREIGYLFGAYRRAAREHAGAMTGKPVELGGSLIRPEATGYGATYFAREMLATRGDEIKGKRVAISGSGNVAQFTAEKVIELGGIVVSLSDSGGTIIDDDGITHERLAWVMEHKNVCRGRIEAYADEFSGPSVAFHAGARPWALTSFGLAFPSATQNEINAAEARAMVAGGCFLVSEGANMPTKPDAIEVFQSTDDFLYGPGKAANAGGVGVSGLEMAQNYQGVRWSREEVDRRLHGMMTSIHKACAETAAEWGKPGDYVAGANIAGFVRVAEAMIKLGI